MSGGTFEGRYPNAAYFIDAIGWIEVGRDDDSPLTSFVRALDMGGMVWEGEDEYESIDEAFQDLERGITTWMHTVGIEAAE